MIYLDHAATSPLRPEVWQAMETVVGHADFNPASVHGPGDRAAEVLESARAELAGLLGGSRESVIFTGGGTQADNLAVLGFTRARREAGPRVLVGAIEHKAVLESARRAEAEGAEVGVLEVDSQGRVSPAHLGEKLESEPERPTLVSVMWANNEIGVVQPVDRLCETAHSHGALFHTDAVQAFGKIPVSLEEVPADLLTITAHKLGGPVGIGLLHVRPGVDLEPLSYGGSQERSLWPGTQNPVAARGFATAGLLAADELDESAPRWREMRDGVTSDLRAAISDLTVHAEAADRLPNLVSVGIPGCDQASLLLALDMAGLAVSGGSACASGGHTESHVIEALGVERDEPYAVLRLSFGPRTWPDDVRRAGEITARTVNRLRRAGG
jgi:cysteine desulfurase